MHRRSSSTAAVNTGYQAIHDEELDQICMAFMFIFLPPDLTEKVMEKKPTTMAETAEYAFEAQRNLRDKNRPLGSTAAKGWFLAIEEDDKSLDDLMVNAVDRYIQQKNANQNPGRNQGHNQGHSGNQKLFNSSGNNSQNLKKKCNYCSKTRPKHLLQPLHAKTPKMNPTFQKPTPKTNSDPEQDLTSQPPLSLPRVKVFPTEE